MRNKIIRELYKKGWSYRKIAKKFGITSARAHQICKGYSPQRKWKKK